MFKLDADNKAILLDLSINFNNALSSKDSFQRPFIFTMPLNFKNLDQRLFEEFARLRKLEASIDEALRRVGG